MQTWLGLLICVLAVAALPSATALMGDGCLLSSPPGDVMLKYFSPPPIKYLPGLRTGSVQGLHFSLEGRDKIRMNWMNPSAPELGPFSPQCAYGSAASNLSVVAEGFHYTYTAGMFNSTLNSVYLDISKLIPCPPITPQPCIRTIFYRCGDKAFGWSDVFQLELQDLSVPSPAGPQIAVIGDMGVPHGLKTIESIASRVTVSDAKSKGNGDGVKLLLHAGDITYANHYDEQTLNNSWVWVDYMANLQDVAARVPYMTSPGNHEAQFQFAAYLNWLPMPTAGSGSSSPFWYSFDYMGVHVVSFSTEHEFSPNSTQYHWIAQDLARANKNRDHVPWIVVMGHRPLYCSSLVCWGRCLQEAPIYRSYLEDLLYQERVDVVIAGHNHQYERSYPVYREKSTQKDYINPQAPVYIVDGAAGNPELNDPTFTPNIEWRAAYEATFSTGFLLMTPSASRLSFQYVMSDGNNVVDSFEIVRQ